MSTEIRHTPIPSAVWRQVGDHEEVELICRECDVNFHAEGGNLHGLDGLIDTWHRQWHGVTACSCWQQVTLHHGHCCFRDLPSDHEAGKRPPCGHWNPTGATP